jgi:hypothetical protein
LQERLLLLTCWLSLEAVVVEMRIIIPMEAVEVLVDTVHLLQPLLH